MLRNRILFVVGLLMLAVASASGQILKGFEKYQYVYTAAAQLPFGVAEGVMISIKPISPEKYISEMTSLEAASCGEEKDVKKFVKAAKKTIKKEKIPLIQEVKDDGMTVEIYAKEGEIIVLTIYDDFAGISVIR